MPQDAIAVEGLSFEYPGVRALDDVAFKVERGSVTALVGPNGAGKTTLLRCLAGLDRPMLGAVEVAGIDVLEEPRAVHRRVGFLSDSFGLYDALSVRQCLSHAAAANGVAEGEVEKTVARTASRLAIGDKLGSRAGELSRGQRQRVAIGQALAHEPEVLLLDEPASGLDPEARHSLAGLFRQLQSEGVTLLVSSHILAELDAYSTHMLVLRAGRVIENRSLSAVVARTRRLRVELAAPDARLRDLLREAGLSVLESDERRAVAVLAGAEADQARVLAQLVAAGLAVSSFSAEREDLQASYMRSVGEAPKS